MVRFERLRDRACRCLQQAVCIANLAYWSGFAERPRGW